jgi:plastocyanin
MRFYGLTLVASAVALGACGGGGNNAADTAAVAAGGDTAAVATATPSPTTGAPAATGTMAPITGTTHEVKMIGDDKGYRFEPADLTVKQGDGIKFVMVSGGPHNVAFDPATIPADVKPQLMANMPNQMTELSSPMFMNPNESYTISFANIKPGAYPYTCTPHLAMGMKGTITVQ